MVHKTENKEIVFFLIRKLKGTDKAGVYQVTGTCWLLFVPYSIKIYGRN
jgi:hypothetical protein